LSVTFIGTTGPPYRNRQ